MMEEMKPESFVRRRARDTGLALTLLLMVIAYFQDWSLLNSIAIFTLLAALIAPDLYRPLSVVWFGLGEAMGWVMSRVILTLIFFLVVTPVGLVRSMLGADALQQGAWKNGQESVFAVRQDCFQPKDLEKPY